MDDRERERNRGDGAGVRARWLRPRRAHQYAAPAQEIDGDALRERVAAGAERV